MFQRAVARYGLAVSLALLAAVPFAVGLFSNVHEASVSALWLSLIAGEWLYVQPSLKSGEGFRKWTPEEIEQTNAELNSYLIRMLYGK